MRTARITWLLIVSFALAATSATRAQEQQESPKMSHATSQPATSSPNAGELLWDLSDPQFNPESCPAWARVATPAWVEPYRGKNGAPEPYRSKPNPLGVSTAGLDRYQGNQFVNYRPETAAYLYSEYTPTNVDYVQGTLPSYEKLVAKYTSEGMSETEKALALLKGAIANEFPHSHMPPRGASVPADRNMTDEALLASGSGWCNEQARVYVRLCQVAGMQGRLIHLMGQSHTVAEVYADGRWVLADSTNIFVARDAEGNLLSAADAHDRGPGQRAYAAAKKRRLMQMHDMPAASLGVTSDEQWAKQQASWRRFDVDAIATSDELYFGVMNNPLPVNARP